jgi:hypothetical protein
MSGHALVTGAGEAVTLRIRSLYHSPFIMELP